MTPVSPELWTLLKQVSRSFYLTLRVLPRAIRPQIGLAYLLARAADTIADTDLIPIATRLQALHDLRDKILGQSTTTLNLGEIARCQEPSSRRTKEAEGRATASTPPTTSGAPAERVLLERIEQVLLLLDRFPAADQELIRQVLETITGGQVLDLERFADATISRIVALRVEQDLDDYTYRVAGCVGEFWTRMCRAHLFPEVPLDDVALLANGVRFGKGLQLVNVLRDLPVDLRHGRCYLPAEELRSCGLTPAALLEPANEPASRPLYHRYLSQAEAHLAAGWAYTNALPRRCVRVRLACAWPILIGQRTIEHLRSGNVLEPARRVKIGRAEVRGLILRSILLYPCPKAWNRLFLKPR